MSTIRTIKVVQGAGATGATGPTGPGITDDASLILNSTADATDAGAHPFTSENAVIGIIDVNDVPVLNIFTGGTFDNDGSLYVGDSVPVGFQGDGEGNWSQNNVAVGPSTMAASTADAGSNTAVGAAALKSLEDGQGNVGIGHVAGQSVVDGNYNVVIGDGADILEADGSSITLIGAQVDSTIGVTDNAIGIGYLVEVTADNTAVIGNGSITDVYFGSDAGNANMIGNVLRLKVSADPPSSPVEGMIYADTDHHLYYYNGTTWKVLDN